MCHSRENHQRRRGSECNCGCAGSQFRRFYTTKEELALLTSYKDELEKELVGVQERISKYKDQ